MRSNQFVIGRMDEQNPKWKQALMRQESMYDREDDIRSQFARDYNRILHCMAYRRLKHKTQVFFATENDHICTRIEHVNHVASVSYTICNFMGLNTELSNAIAIGHDLGHAPFGHAGEKFINNIVENEIKDTFWHERNSLRFVDSFETLQDPEGKERNLNLTYAVRDGILLHCGEIDEQSIFPREDYLNLEDITCRSQHSPFTWEGCIVKISDKVAYLGRDIEDALSLRILDRRQLRELKSILKKSMGVNLRAINTTTLMHDLIIDLCSNSNPEKGLNFSPEYFEAIRCLKEFSSAHIYMHPQLQSYWNYAELVLTSIYETLKKQYDVEHIQHCLSSKRFNPYPLLQSNFYEWLLKYSNIKVSNYSKNNTYKNHKIYNIQDQNDYKCAIIDFISGMTDNFAIKSFEELTNF